MDKRLERLAEIIGNAVNGFWYCDRVWSAWGCGTMSENDFYPAEDDEDWVNETAEDVLKAIQEFQQQEIVELKEQIEALTSLNSRLTQKLSNLERVQPEKPKWETPDQYKARTGEDWPDDGPVWELQ